MKILAADSMKPIIKRKSEMVLAEFVEKHVGFYIKN
jgi:hypothetical protein